VALRVRQDMKKLAAVSFLIALSACTIQQADKPATKAGAKTPAGDTKTGADGKDGDGTTPGETPAGDGVVKSGSVTLSQSSFTAGPTTINSFSASALFFETVTTGATGGTTATCKTSTDGACTISECDFSGAEAPADPGTPAAPAKAPHAGEITVAASETLTLAVDDKGAYAPKTGQTQLWATGSDITVKAAGDTIPAFEKVLKAPASVTVTAPAAPAAGQSLDVDRAKELPFTWTGGGDGDVSVSVSAALLENNKVTKSSSITCKFPSKDNKGTISAAAMGKLVATDTGSVIVGSSTTEAFEAGGWKLNVTASAGGLPLSAKIK
jgi:hypothetical protein